MTLEFLTWALACVSESNFKSVPPKSEATQLPMNEIMEPCLIPDIDVVPIDSAALDYAEDGVEFVEGAHTKFVTAAEDHMRVRYQELISGGEPFTVLAVYEDDQGNYKSRTGQVLAFTLGDYFFQETEFPLINANYLTGNSPQVPSGEWLICRAGYEWESCPETDWEEHDKRVLDYFSGEQDGSLRANDLLGQNDYSGEFFGVVDGVSELCTEASEDDWRIQEEVYDNGGKGNDALYYPKDEFDLTEAESSFEDHFDAMKERIKSLATVDLYGENTLFYGAYYCENDLCYDVEFE